MKIRKTEVLDIHESNIDEVKIEFANKIITKINPIINTEYQALVSELNETQTLISDKLRENKIVKEITAENSLILKKKKKIRKLLELMNEISNYNIGDDLKRNFKLILKVVDDLSEKRLDLNITDLTKTLNEKQ